MACDRAHERALMLSLGLFGAPAGEAKPDREARAVDKEDRTGSAVAAKSR